MYTYIQIWIGAQSIDRILAVRHVGEQTGAEEPAFAVQVEDGMIDDGGVSQIISIDQ